MKTDIHSRPARQNGAGIVETMVGILIGMIVVLVIYNVFALAERHKRDALGIADAQTTGLYAQFVLAREIANSGNGIMTAMNDLIPCTNVALRPNPVIITDGGAANVSDSIEVKYSTAARVMWPVLFVGPSVAYPAMAVTTDPFYVQSPNGFRLNDRVIAIQMAAPFNCDMTIVTNNPAPDLNGVVMISHPATGSLYNPAIPAKLLNLGQVGDAVQRTLFDVGPDVGPCVAASRCQLRSTDLLAAAPVANPIAQNIVLLKAQYGVDCNNNGVILWTSATANNLCGDPLPVQGTTGAVMYRPADVQAFDRWALRRVRAIRIGIVVRSDEPDLKDGPVGQTATLFDCSTHNAACQGRITLNNTVLTDRYRFRFYETVIPLRNAIWNFDPVIT